MIRETNFLDWEMMRCAMKRCKWTGFFLIVLLLLTTTWALAKSSLPIGGQLYDRWWAVTGATPPSADHPLWNGQSADLSGAETWRCVTCHGWDYRGAYGYPSLLDAARVLSTDDLLADLKGRTDPKHDFSTILDESSLIALAEFISGRVDDVSVYEDAQTLASIGNAEHGKSLFTQTCTRCHGEDGRGMNFATTEAPAYQGTLAKSDPLLVLHKIRFGQPGTDMPSGEQVGWSLAEAADVLAYLQTLPGERSDPGLARGAALYDDWRLFAIAGVSLPTETQPLYLANGEISDTETWRCVSCHGWDYADLLDQSDRPVEEILPWLNGQNNEQHDFSTYLDPNELTDLSRFLSEGLADTSQFIGLDGGSLGDALRGRMLFNATCTYCHGMDGTLLNIDGREPPVFLGPFARSSPVEFLHKVRGGQPGTQMPAGLERGWETQFAVDVLAYAQSLPEWSMGVDVAVGGGLYDKWYAVLGVEPPNGDMPLWGRQATNSRSGADTWRCVECHGWDYKGKDGAYGSGSHLTGFPGVLDAAHSLSVDELVAVLKGVNDPAHDFSAYMDVEALSHLAVFLKYGAVNDDDFIDDISLNAVGGDLTHGQELFELRCSSCHGTDGKRIVFRTEGVDEYLGAVADRDPWRFLHKTRFGTPGTEMPIGYYLGVTVSEGRDLLRYAQTLPTGQEIPVVEPTPRPVVIPTKLPGGPASNIWTGILTGLGVFFGVFGSSLLFISILLIVVGLVVWGLRRRR